MAQWVAKLHARAPRFGEPDLRDETATLMSDLRTAANVSSLSQAEMESRGLDAAEVEACADLLAALRDALGASTRVTYHLCRHDEGVGFCTGVVER